MIRTMKISHLIFKFTDFDKVHVKWRRKLVVVWWVEKYSNTITTPISVTIEYIKEVIVVHRHEERDDGNPIVIPETTYENVVFTNTKTVNFNGIVNVGEDGIISHKPIVITVDETIDDFSSVKGHSLLVVVKNMWSDWF